MGIDGADKMGLDANINASADYDYCFTRFKLHQIGNYLTRLERDKSETKSDMISAAVHSLSHAIKSAKMQTTEPFKPLVQTHEYKGKCRRQSLR